MITSLGFINSGEPWPPADADERARIEEHIRNEAIYNDLHDTVFSKYATYLNDREEDDKKVVIILGWGEKATSSYVALTIGEDPDVEVNGEDDFTPRPDEEVLIDASRHGLGLYEISQDGISCINPRSVYLVTDPGNMRKVTAYVVFSQFRVGDKDFVKFTIHTAGQIQHLIYSIKEGKLDENLDIRDAEKFPAYAGMELDDNGRQSTEVDELLVVRVDNALSSERRYGRSDYTPSVVRLIEALELAFARREEVLARFARPVFVGPEGAFNHYNFSKNKYEIRLDEPILVEPGASTEPKYLTWQAELSAVEKAIEEKMDQLLYMLDLSRVLLAGRDSGGVASGQALTIRLIPSLSRARRYAKAMKAAIPKVLSLNSKLQAALQLGDGPAFEPEAVNVVIKNGIPRDMLQDIQACSLAVAGGFMSLEAAINITQGLEIDSDAMLAELSRIRGAPEPGLRPPGASAPVGGAGAGE
jgi:hypothetical protein